MPYYWGMHAYWWVCWFLIWFFFLSFFMPVRRITYRKLQSQPPLQILQERYAAGEISSEEYDERRARLLRDANV